MYNHQSSEFGPQHANAIVSIIAEFIPVNSVLDVGCGLGNFVSAWLSQGVSNTLGIDGPWVRCEQFLAPWNHFQSIDLNENFDLGQRFDLVMCLEVAEHLLPSASEFLINSLIMHGDTVVFSAALPGQGGQNHINERDFSEWHSEFLKYGYQLFDCFRSRLWNNETIPWWYRQNMFLYTCNSSLKKRLCASGLTPLEFIQSCFHPNALLEKNQELELVRGELEHQQKKFNALEAGMFTWSAYGRILIKKLKRHFK